MEQRRRLIHFCKLPMQSPCRAARFTFKSFTVEGPLSEAESHSKAKANEESDAQLYDDAAAARGPGDSVAVSRASR